MRKIFIFILIFSFFNFQIQPLYASGLVADFLCELGINLYKQGRYVEACNEFRKVLLLQENHSLALEYLQKIRGVIEKVPSQPSIIEAKPTRKEAIEEELEYLEKKQITSSEKIITSPIISAEEIKKEISSQKDTSKIMVPQKQPPTLEVIRLDQLLESQRFFEIEQEKSLILLGKNISRFLVTEPEKLIVERKNSEELIITGKDLGFTYLHIWDQEGRHTLEIQTIFPKQEITSYYEETWKKEEERAKNLKVRYNLSWFSYETGRRLNELNQQYYSWYHGLGLQGPTPYGDLDASTSIRKALATNTDLTYLTLGLSNAKIGPFKGFNLRGFDYSPGFSNLIFPGASLRGVMLDSSVFENKMHYNVFWGREGGGRYGDLSPDLQKQKHSFLEGINLGFTGFKDQYHRFTFVKGWGRDRLSYLNPQGYDLESNWYFKNYNLGYEVAYDSETFAYLIKSRFNLPKLTLSTEFRNTSRNFLNILGSGWRQGEIGGLINLVYALNEKLNTGMSLDLYLDRLYPAEDNPDRLNEDISWYLNYQIDPYSSLNLNYSLNNYLGRAYPFRYQNFGFTLSRTFRTIRDIYTYFNYFHQETKNFYSHSSDYINDRLNAGLRFNILGNLYYYLNKEINFTEARYYNDYSSPHALDTGIGWSGRLLKFPLYGNFRLGFRDEEAEVAPLTFISGQDTLEGYLELSYRASDDREIYGAARFKNNWQDSPTTSKGMEMEFNAGMRYLWDTKVRWEAIGNIEGYVFKDFNSDGLKQKEEPPIKDIKIWLGKNKFQITDQEGYFKFKGIRAQKAYVALEPSSIPQGYVLTTPNSYEIDIIHHGTQRVYFGLVSRSEISGYVFEDANEDGIFNKGDIGVYGVKIKLGDKETVTDLSGKYSFVSLVPGNYTLSLEMSSLPIYYLPSVSIKKEISLSEGELQEYNFPLKRIKE